MHKALLFCKWEWRLRSTFASPWALPSYSQSTCTSSKVQAVMVAMVALYITCPHWPEKEWIPVSFCYIESSIYSAKELPMGNEITVIPTSQLKHGKSALKKFPAKKPNCGSRNVIHKKVFSYHPRRLAIFSPVRGIRYIVVLHKWFKFISTEYGEV